MITKNFNMFKQWVISGTRYSNNQSTEDILPYPIVDVNGTSYSMLGNGSGTYDFWARLRSLVTVNNSFGYATTLTYSDCGDISLWVGSGDSEPTENDYSLTPIDSADITSNSFAFARTVSDGKTYHTFTRQFTANSTITIKEVGLLKCLQSQPTAAWINLLLAREVLPEAKTYNAGDTFTITMVVEID